ncbi:GNAT family N-acetyltransferase [Haloparvum sp. PAK95]|uniref:GNAT family N-acetyltransferase n=1 Tax=Haloparvum sp. PAK95 TaxID=3418962 RepID=UPI003D2F3204
MEFALLGWPDEEPTLRLDYRAFSYAGKFVTGGTGIAVLRAADPVSFDPDQPLPDGLDPATFADDVVAAVAFNADRTEPETLWLRYVTVHAALRGEGFGPELVGEVLDRATAGGYESARIAVNNPFAYEALHKVGFAFTGRETGIAELVLERPLDAPATVDRETYQAGLDRFRDRERELSSAEEAFLADRARRGPPESHF